VSIEIARVFYFMRIDQDVCLSRDIGPIHAMHYKYIRILYGAANKIRNGKFSFADNVGNITHAE